MLQRAIIVLLAAVLALGVLGFLSPMHEGMASDEMSLTCLLHCLAQTDHGVAGDLVAPLLLVVVAAAVAVVTISAAPIVSTVRTREGPISWYCERMAYRVCKRE